MTAGGPKGECLVCRKHRGDLDIPGGMLHGDNLICASHAFPLEGGSDNVYLGWLVVEPTRHVPGLGDLTDAEAEAVGLAMARLSRALMAATDAEHIYSFVLGHHVPHLHVHLMARYPGTPRQYWGGRVDEWPDAPRGGPAQVEVLCERLRQHLETS